MKDIELWHGNCLELMKNIPDKSVDMIVTDPPYNIITGGNCNGVNSIRPKGMLSDNIELMKYIPPFNDWLVECFRVLKENSHAYFMVNFSNLLEFGRCIEEVGFKIHNLLVWQKNNCTPSQYYMKNCEYIFFCRKGKAKYINNIGNSLTVHKINNIIGKKMHPTEKPVELMQFYIDNSSFKGDVVLDPFMGSGTTGVACVNTNRKFIGIELDDNYFGIAKIRIDNAIIEKQQQLF